MFLIDIVHCVSIFLTHCSWTIFHENISKATYLLKHTDHDGSFIDAKFECGPAKKAVEFWRSSNVF